jgi:Ca2+-binding RTX toxin-like protein
VDRAPFGMKLRRVLVVVTMAAAGVLTIAGPASAATTCVFDPVTRIVDVNAPDNLSQPVLHVQSGAIHMTAATTGPCKDLSGTIDATTTTTDLIRVTGVDGTNQGVFIDLTGGPFAPGFTDETGDTDEIEFQIGMGTGNDSVFVTGSNSAVTGDVIRLGSDGINLNGDADVDTVNASSTPALPSGVENYQVSAGDGDDDVFADGSGAAGSAAFGSALTLFGGAGHDELTGGTQADSMDGGPGDDILLGGSGDDTLVGGADDDILNAGETGETIGDTASYSGSAAAVSVNLTAGTGFGAGSGTDTIALTSVENVIGSPSGDLLVGDGQSNRLTGGAGADDLQGQEAGDILNGGTAADMLRGGGGGDSLEGGDQADTADYSASAAAVQVNLATPSAAGGDAAGDLLTSIENATGSDVAGAGDTLTGDAGANQLDGGAGPDTLLGAAGADNLLGGTHDDMVQGGAAGDSLDGGEGNETNGDTLDYSTSALAVQVNLASGTGTTGDAAGDAVAANSIEDVLGSPSGDNIRGDSQDNTLTGGLGGDSIFGLSGADVADGGPGSDSFGQTESNDGSDILNGGPDEDFVDYSFRTTAVVISLDGFANDGEDSDDNGTANELDNVGADIERFLSGAGNDDLTTDGDHEVFFTGNGADTVNAGAGFDNLDGEAGNDILNGAAGNDIFFTSSGNDVLTGGEDADTFHQGAGPDGGDNVDGGPGMDGVHYESRLNAISVTADDVANDGEPLESDNVDQTVEQIVTGLGDDFVAGDPDVANDIQTGEGTDTVSYELGGPVDAFLGVGQATVDGIADSLDAENLTGSSENDTIRGTSGANEISGLGGDDTIEGLGGADVIDGGEGSEVAGDTASYELSSEAVSASLTTGAGSGGDAEDDSFSDVENLEGSAQGDELIGDVGQNSLRGGGGHDVLDGKLGADELTGEEDTDVASYADRSTAVVVDLDDVADDGAAGEGDNVDTESVTGGSAGDRLTGDAVANVLEGGGGNDVLAGRLGDDTFNGGAGKDKGLFAGSTAVSANLTTGVASGQGSDVLTALENLTGSSRNDVLTGNASANTLIGGSGRDRLTGAKGSDVMNGGGGKDFLAARDRKRDRVIGGSGKDRARVDARLDVVRGVEQVA